MSRSLSKMKHYFNGFNYLGAGLSDSNNPRESSIIESFRNVNQHAYKSLNHLKNEMNDKFINKNLLSNNEKAVLISQGRGLKPLTEISNTDQVVVVSGRIKRRNKNTRSSFRIKAMQNSKGVH